MHDADNAHGIIAFNMSIDHDIREHKSNPDMRPQLRTQWATLRMIRKPVIQAFETGIELLGSGYAGFASDVGKNIGGVRVGGRSNYDPRH